MNAAFPGPEAPREGPETARSHRGDRTFTRRAFLVGAGVMALGMLPVVNTYRFEVSRHQRELPGLTRALRVAHLSDLHYGPYIKARSVRAWVNATMKARPDVIVITGDFVDSHLEDDVLPLLRELARLRAPLGVYGVWGNHDYGSFRRPRGGRHADWLTSRADFQAALANAGVRILRNEGVQLRSDVFLAGVDDLWWGDVQFEGALRGAHGATLLLSHNPDLLPRVPEHVSMTLCGHTHGGQVRLPMVGALTTSSRYGERFAQGFVNGSVPGFVSRGLGVSALPLRLNCPAEVALLEFTPPGVS